MKKSISKYIRQIRGVSYKPSDLHKILDENSIVLLRANNIKDGQINFDDVVYVDRKRVSPDQILQKGDVLICASSGSVNLVGKAAQYLDGIECTFGAFCKVARPKEDMNKYIGLFFQSPFYRRKISQIANGANINNIKNEHIDSFEISILSKEDEIKFISKMESMINILRKKQIQIDLLENLVKSRFVELFGTLDNPVQEFKKATLKELCAKITDGKHGGCTQEVGTERYFVGAREIYDNVVHYDTAPEINLAEFEKDYKRCNVEIGDFLIVNTGATIGKSAIATDPRTECTLLQKSVALLKVKRELLNPVFLQYCYKVNEKMYKVESASAQPNLLLSKINSTEIYVPSIELQNQFAAFVKQTDKSKFAIQKSIDELQTLYDSLMQEYFG